jgi:hypothetical protein
MDPCRSKPITSPTGAIDRDVLMPTIAVTAEAGKRFVSVSNRDGGNLALTDVVCNDDGGVWCRKPSDTLQRPPWELALFLQPCKITHFGRRHVDVEDAVTEGSAGSTNWDTEEWEAEVATVLPEAAALAPPPLDLCLPAPPADVAAAVANVVGTAVDPHGLEFAALAWLVAAGKVVAGVAVDSQMVSPAGTNDHVVVWVPDDDGDGDHHFAVARCDGGAFVRVAASNVGDYSHGGVVAVWAARMDDASSGYASKEVLTIYSNRKCDERQAVYSDVAACPAALVDATNAALGWAFEHHPLGEEFAFYNTVETHGPSPAGS